MINFSLEANKKAYDRIKKIVLYGFYLLIAISILFNQSDFRSAKKEIKKEMITYIEKKYDFTPKIVKFDMEYENFLFLPIYYDYGEYAKAVVEYDGIQFNVEYFKYGYNGPLSDDYKKN